MPQAVAGGEWSPSAVSMQRINIPPAQADQRLADATDWLATLDARWSSIEPASADASFRRYFRVRSANDNSTAIVMDAPPPKEDVRPFLNISRLLASGDVNVPVVYAADEARGLLLLGDLGNMTYLRALTDAADGERQRLFSDAINTLVQLQQIDPAQAEVPLARYDAALLRREIDLFPEWHLGRHCQIELTNDEKNALERIYAVLIAGALAQPTVLVHRDYMPRNLMVTGERNPGVLDYQDAVIGPVSYDVASLMRDAFLSWEEPQIIDWVARYWDRARKAGLPVREDFSEFYREFEWMGLQRHLKVLGIFARINYRDGKPHYLADTPRFVNYVRHAATRYQAFAPLGSLLDRIEGTATKVGYTF